MFARQVNGTWIHTVSGSTMGHHTFAALNFHCHAPTCLSMEVFACAVGVALEDCNGTVGPPARQRLHPSTKASLKNRLRIAQCITSRSTTPQVGKLLCRQMPVYGGTGDALLNGTLFDESGYISIPDCFWGPASQLHRPQPHPTSQSDTATVLWVNQDLQFEGE